MEEPAHLMYFYQEALQIKSSLANEYNSGLSLLEVIIHTSVKT